MITPDGMQEAAAWYLPGRIPATPTPHHCGLTCEASRPILIHVGDAEILLHDSTASPPARGAQAST
jgi:hypothetical protein